MRKIVSGLLVVASSTFVPSIGAAEPASNVAPGGNAPAPAQLSAEETARLVEEAKKTVNQGATPPTEASAAKTSANQKTFSAAVNVIRQGERVEAVFRNGEAYALPRGSTQRAIFDALSESERTGKAVSVTIDTKTNTIQSVSGAGEKSHAK